MSMIRLKPAFKDYIWGGDRLKKEFGKGYDGEVLAETWELSVHPDGPSFVEGGEFGGMAFPDYLKKGGPQILGENCRRFSVFPILAKFIDAKQKLSLQVHPGDDYALENEDQLGKSEWWYIVDAEPGSGIYYGLKQAMPPGEFLRQARDGALEEALCFVPVKKGESYFIPAGTLHAIGPGVLVVEIQENSNVTYRVCDFGRLGSDGKPRPLHIDKALDVADLSGSRPEYDFGNHAACCRYFTVDEVMIDGEEEIFVGRDSFCSLIFTAGSGEIECGGDVRPYMKGDSIFIEAGSGQVLLRGSGHVLKTTVPGEDEQ